MKPDGRPPQRDARARRHLQPTYKQTTYNPVTGEFS